MNKILKPGELKEMVQILFVVALLFMLTSTPAIASQTPNVGGGYKGLGDFIIKNIQTIYLIIDGIITLVIAVYFVFIIVSLNDSRDRKVVGAIMSLFIMASILPNGNFLMNLLVETVFGEPSQNIITAEGIKGKKYNSNEATNELLQVLMVTIQLIGKILMIYQVFSLAALARGAKQGSAGWAVLGLVAAAILYNIDRTIQLLSKVGGVIGEVINGLFNA